MKIVQTPHKALFKKAAPVKNIDADIKRLISNMKKALKKSDIGVGLAAPQVGVSKQIFLASASMPESNDKDAEKIHVFINPKIISKAKTKKSKKKSQSKDASSNQPLEGCLSIKDIWGTVTRDDTVKLSYQDGEGKQQTKTFTGFMATIIQHEMDHLNGILFTQRVLEQGGTLFRETPGEKQFEELEI